MLHCVVLARVAANYAREHKGGGVYNKYLFSLLLYRQSYEERHREQLAEGVCHSCQVAGAAEEVCSALELGDCGRIGGLFEAGDQGGKWTATSAAAP